MPGYQLSIFLLDNLKKFLKKSTDHNDTRCNNYPIKTN